MNAIHRSVLCFLVHFCSFSNKVFNLSWWEVVWMVVTKHVALLHFAFANKIRTKCSLICPFKTRKDNEIGVAEYESHHWASVFFLRFLK